MHFSIGVIIMTISAEFLTALDAIRTAFPDNGPPPVDAVVSKYEFGRDPEREQISDFLQGRRWSDITMDDLENYIGQHSAILTFLTPLGFQYYLPAFLSLSLMDFERADDVPIRIMMWFCKWGAPDLHEFHLEMWKLLTRQQLDAVERTARVLDAAYGPLWMFSEAIQTLQAAKGRR